MSSKSARHGNSGGRTWLNLLDRAASDAVIEVIETRFDRQGFGFWALEEAATGTFIGLTGWG